MTENLILVDATGLGSGIGYLAEGRHQRLENQLIAQSRQPHILASTPKDAAKRFADREALEAWYSKGRLVHWLLGRQTDLAGIIWYGPEPYPLGGEGMPNHTFAIRLYEGYTGKGLAGPFMALSLRRYAGSTALQEPGFNGIWLETDAVNQPALRTYGRLGYEETARDSERVTMVLSPERIRTICSPGA